MNEEWTEKSRSEAVIETADYLRKDIGIGKVIDPRTDEDRRFDAMFHMMKGIMFELERISGQLAALNGRIDSIRK